MEKMSKKDVAKSEREEGGEEGKQLKSSFGLAHTFLLKNRFHHLLLIDSSQMGIAVGFLSRLNFFFFHPTNASVFYLLKLFLNYSFYLFFYSIATSVITFQVSD